MTQAGGNQGQGQGISRTICIGLGGTGRDVLMRIRRLIVDRYGDLESFPIVSFVHIDTDKAAIQGSNMKSGNTYRGVDLTFKPSEQVNATMDTNAINSFVQGMEQRLTYGRESPYDHIGLWFPPQLVRNIKAVEDGAKGIRPVGRLAFFHNYQNIKKTIENAEGRTRGKEAMMLQQRGLRIEKGLSIFVVGSLCGGTGSGMFLDVAYSLRKNYGDQGAQIVAYLVICPKLYGDSPNIIANTYAALKELNHYTNSGTTFQACYDKQSAAVVNESRPPFEYTYLISHQNSEDYEILDGRKLCNVIAHKIALDFSGELAPVVKGMRDNFLQHMLQWDSHPRPNPQRYLTFGLAAIYFPRYVISQIALTRISNNLVTYWLNGEGQSPDPQVALDRFLKQWHGNLQQRDGLNSRLEAAVEEGDRTFDTYINSWKGRLERSTDDIKNKDDRQALKGNLIRELREQFRKVQPGETENTRGIWLTRLQQVSPEIEKKFKEEIDNFLAEVMIPGKPDFSIKTGRDWLDALRTELELHQRQLEEEITNFRGMKKSEDLEKKWQSGEISLEEIENKNYIFGGKNKDFQQELKKILRAGHDLIRHNFNLIVRQLTLESIKNLQAHIRDQSTDLSNFNRLVANVKSAYEAEERELAQLNFDEMSGEAIFDIEDIEICYKALMPEKEYRSQLDLISKQITDSLLVKDSLAFVMNRVTQEQLQEETKKVIDHLFGKQSSQTITSVIKRFLQKYPTSNRIARLTQVRREAQPLLKLNASDPYFYKTSAKESELIGFKDTDDQEVKQFRLDLTSNLAISEDKLKPTQAEEEILMVTEYAGFPLRLIQGLEEMRNPYLREVNVHGSFLHNDYRTVFTDIIPPDVALMEGLQDIFYPCLALGLIRRSSEDNSLEFTYYDELRYSTNQAKLSPVWDQALEILANHPDMQRALDQLLQNVINQIKQQSQQWKENYLPKLENFVAQVKQLPQENPNYPYKDTVIGRTGTIENPGKEGIINRFRKKMESPNGSSMNTSTNQNFAKEKITAGEDGDLIVDAEIIDSPADPWNNSSNNMPQDNMSQDNMSQDNVQKRREALKQLKQDIDDGILEPEEYDRLRKEILKKYPV